MQKQYRVKLLDGHTANENQITDGYLGGLGVEVPLHYTRGEAIKKAKAFGGKIEGVKSCIAFEELRIAKITRGSLVWGVERLLNEVEPEFVDTNKELNEKLYTADVFANIYDKEAVDSRGIEQFEQLINAMHDFNYVLIIE